MWYNFWLKWKGSWYKYSFFDFSFGEIHVTKLSQKFYLIFVLNISSF